MKFNKTLQMIPIVMGLHASTNVYAHTDLSFNEDDIQQNRINIDSQTFTYVGSSNRMIFDKLYLRERFNQMHSAWVKETRFSSRVDKIMNNRHFVNITALGENAVPFILEELERNPSNLVWALNVIYNRKISSGTITIREACNKWVAWGRQNSLMSI